MCWTVPLANLRDPWTGGIHNLHILLLENRGWKKKTWKNQGKVPNWEWILWNFKKRIGMMEWFCDMMFFSTKSLLFWEIVKNIHQRLTHRLRYIEYICKHSLGGIHQHFFGTTMQKTCVSVSKGKGLEFQARKVAGRWISTKYWLLLTYIFWPVVLPLLNRYICEKISMHICVQTSITNLTTISLSLVTMPNPQILGKKNNETKPYGMTKISWRVQDGPLLVVNGIITP